MILCNLRMNQQSAHDGYFTAFRLTEARRTPACLSYENNFRLPVVEHRPHQTAALFRTNHHEAGASKGPHQKAFSA